MNSPENNPDKAAKVFADDRANVFHSWSAQAQISPMAIAGGAGSYFWDFTGKKYLDFSCQLVFTNIGHQHPKVIAAIKEQADILTTIAPQHANEARNEAAKRILEISGDNFKKVFFTNAGADGIENAVRMARLHSNRHKILSTYRSYHGNTGSAINATGDPRRFPNEFAFGHVHFWGPYLYRSAAALQDSQGQTGAIPQGRGRAGELPDSSRPRGSESPRERRSTRYRRGCARVSREKL